MAEEETSSAKEITKIEDLQPEVQACARELFELFNQYGGAAVLKTIVNAMFLAMLHEPNKKTAAESMAKFIGTHLTEFAEMVQGLEDELFGDKPKVLTLEKPKIIVP